MNAKLLYAQIRQKGYSIGGFCSKIRMSRTAFYRKCKGISEFKHSEIITIVDVLGLASPGEIFFNQKVS